tara:strand:- start:1537 stop:2976 length:1440 start_codon:yes stop_codon:yes gene_type:complete
MEKKAENIKKFTYGHQFEVGKASIKDYVDLICKNAPSRERLEEDIRKIFFEHHSGGVDDSIKQDNQRKLAMNCFLSLRAYGLLVDKAGLKNEYSITNVSEEIKNSSNNEIALKTFAKHILINLSGTDLLRSLETLNRRGEKVTLQALIQELNEMGYELSKNVIYISTMRNWLNEAGLFDTKNTVAWEKYYELTGLEGEILDSLYNLDPKEKDFFLTMLELGIVDFVPWNQVLHHIDAIKRNKYDVKMFPSTTLKKLEVSGLIEVSKETQGRGAKPHSIKLSSLARNDYLAPFVKNISNLVSLDINELNKPLKVVLDEVSHEDKHIKGKALELLAIWIIRLCSLRFTKWRKRDAETGGGEVDVTAASDTFVYSRWQIQCKNTKKVSVDVIAKEVGMTFTTNADIVMIITTGEFSADAVSYAARVNSNSRYNIILINGNDLKEVSNNLDSLTEIMNRIAKRTYARKELGMSDEEFDDLIDI